MDTANGRFRGYRGEVLVVGIRKRGTRCMCMCSLPAGNHLGPGPTFGG